MTPGHCKLKTVICVLSICISSPIINVLLKQFRYSVKAFTLDPPGYNDDELKIEVRASISMHDIFDWGRGKLYSGTLYHKRKRGGEVQEVAFKGKYKEGTGFHLLIG